MAEPPRILREHHLKMLKLPTFLRNTRNSGGTCSTPA